MWVHDLVALTPSHDGCWPHCYLKLPCFLSHALPRCVGEGNHVIDLAALPLHQKWLSALLFCSTIMGTEKQRYLFPEGNCFCPSCAPGLSVRDAAWLPLLLCSLEPQWVPGCICGNHLCLSMVSPPLLVPNAHLHMPLCVDISGMFVCWTENPLLNYIV